MSSIFQQPPFNFQYKVGVANLGAASEEVISKTGIIADDLYRTLVIPRNVLVLGGQRARLLLTGTRQNPAGTMVIVVRVQGIDVVAQTMAIDAVQRAWQLESSLYRNQALLACYSIFQSSIVFESGVGGVLAGSQFHRTVAVDFANNDILIQLRVTINGAGDSFANTNAHIVIE